MAFPLRPLYHEEERLFAVGTEPAPCCSARRARMMVTSHRVVVTESTRRCCGTILAEGEDNLFLRDVHSTTVVAGNSGRPWMAVTAWVVGLALLGTGIAFLFIYPAVGGPVLGGSLIPLGVAAANMVAMCKQRSVVTVYTAHNGRYVELLMPTAEAEVIMATLHFLREDIAPMRAALPTPPLPPGLTLRPTVGGGGFAVPALPALPPLPAPTLPTPPLPPPKPASDKAVANPMTAAMSGGGAAVPNPMTAAMSSASAPHL